MCEHVAQVLENEKISEEQENAKKSKRRLQLLQTLRQRHEINFELEQKAGIKKPLYESATQDIRPQTRPFTGKVSSCFDYESTPLKLGFINPEERKKLYKDTETVKRLKNPKQVFL